MHQPIDDHFLSKYRALLYAEDLAFDELEHACEEGDRMQFDKDMVDWQNALEHKILFLANRRGGPAGPMAPTSVDAAGGTCGAGAPGTPWRRRSARTR